MSNPVDLDPREFAATLEILKKIDFLVDVPDDQLKGILFSLQKESFSAKKTILFQGEIANRMFIIRKGDVSITTKNKGAKLHLADLAPPAYFGEISLLRPTSATATATAGEQGADLLILTHEAMARLAKTLPDIHQKIQTTIEKRIESKQKAKREEDSSEIA
ncbi:hypothetical protein BVX98_00170 [bacterium F11]|nr:hypothetical protein BVX98_00170 [bacterium F11]